MKKSNSKLLRCDAPHLPPDLYPRTTKKLSIARRLAEKSAPTPHQSFFGTSAAVYLARVPPVDHPIALKVVYSFSPDPADTVHHRHKQEIDVHKFLCSLDGSQRFILQFYCFWIEQVEPEKLPDWTADPGLANNQSLFIATEYIPMNLEQFQNDNETKIFEPEICLIAYQIAKGIEFLQNNHVVHRDIKPDNILIDGLGRTVIFDFGVALHFKPEDKMKYRYEIDDGFCKGGASENLPPEILTQKPGKGVHLDYSSCDIYALGKLMTLIWKPRPFTFESIAGFTSVRSSIQTLMNTMIVDEPTSRASLQDILQELSRLLSISWNFLESKTFLNNPTIDELKTDVLDQDLLVKLTLAAAENIPVYQYQLGFMYYGGVGVKKDEKLALQYFRQAADQNHPEAQFMLASCYDQGKCVARDEKIAVHYYKGAADQGHMRSQERLADILLWTQSELKNEALAIHYLKLSADQGHPGAQVRLATCSSVGRGTPKNDVAAFEYYKRAADNGHVDAQLRVGFMYLLGMGCIIDMNLALKYIKLAAEQGDPDAQTKLGDLYSKGSVVPKDEEHAVRCYRLAAKQGNADANCNLGNCYLEGQGIAKNPKLAIKHYRAAIARNNLPRALLSLGACYLNGVGVEKDQKLGVSYLEKVAESDEPKEAQYNLGVCYQDGLGVVKDLDKAIHFFQLAAAQNQPQAQMALAKLQRH